MRDPVSLYARVFRDACVAAGDSASFEAIASLPDFVDAVPGLAAFLARGDVSMRLRADFLREAFSGMPERALNFAVILLGRGLIGSLREVTSRLDVLAGEATGITRVKITSAVPLGKDELAKLRPWLAESLGAKDIKVETAVDPGLLSGFVAESPGSRLDSSGLGKIRKMGAAFMKTQRM